MKLDRDTLKHVDYNLLKKEFRIIPCFERIQAGIQRVSLKQKINIGKATLRMNPEQTIEFQVWRMCLTERWRFSLQFGILEP